MTTLFAIAAEFQAAARTLADLDLDAQTIADTLEGLSGAVEVKAQSVAHVIRAIDADAAAVTQWAKDAMERAAAAQKRAEHLREYLAAALLACGIQKVEGPGIALSFRKSTAVVIDSAEQVPAEFYVSKPAPPPAVSKTLIGDALKAGRDVPGARMETRMNLQVK